MKLLSTICLLCLLFFLSPTVQGQKYYIAGTDTTLVNKGYKTKIAQVSSLKREELNKLKSSIEPKEYTVVTGLDSIKALLPKVKFAPASYQDDEENYVKSITCENGMIIKSQEENLSVQKYYPTERLLVIGNVQPSYATFYVSDGTLLPSIPEEIVYSKSEQMRYVNDDSEYSPSNIEVFCKEKDRFISILNIDDYFDEPYGLWQGETLYIRDYDHAWWQIVVSKQN